ncbi:NADH:flavin oxidoreductase/NADH oxidase [Pontibacter oryzae]|uniref:NADH:flavin oxidoreductase/NADH oxidase n=1 Tax=Pontibacter oryzae TaxID=2304593 RepID=A0A399SIU6_9BACT|nr:NADH:flavin oxidoreductase/NADH oxidase [Pontibacter oryzae]RIJ42413.1 NADH:flavin oxidoreductase/NADH oxidase [Pontibacter oryzae]
MSILMSPLPLRGITLKNRIVVSPMCQYSSQDGFANDWHLVHLGSRAVGGAGLILFEASAVVPEGRITPHDLGIWKDEHIEGLKRITDFISAQGSVPGIQLAHAGRKASHHRPWDGGKAIAPNEENGWQTVAPSPIPFQDGEPTPHELTEAEIGQVVDAFEAATKRSLEAGFKVIELHAAHGYLLHAFYSPLSNQRTDKYGGSFENRIRLLLEVTERVRKVWPQEYPLFVRISATDWTEGGWTGDDSVALALALKKLGVDLVDCSTGGNVPQAEIPIAPSYQVPFSQMVRQRANILTGAVGMVTEAQQAEEILAGGQADVVLLARELLRDPYFPMHAALQLGSAHAWPPQYERAKPRR